ncbi:MAG: hypothetical protein JWN14_2952, partial [Chthonomonadales bacterium]|nr:hypothetical protein [Chthonomonadales bacterium]
QDVLHYHSRRTSPRQRISGVEALLLSCFSIVSVFCIEKAVHDPQVAIAAIVVLTAYPVFLFSLIVKILFLNDRLARREAAEARFRYKQAISLLTYSSNPAAVGPLAEILGLPDLPREVPIALRRLLLEFHVLDSALLNSKQRACLLGILTETDLGSLALQRATVKAVALIGDSMALPVLKHLAAGEGIAANSPEIQADADLALRELQARINDEKANK